MSQFVQQNSDSHVNGFAILVTDGSGGPPTQAFCQAYREANNLKIPVLYDAKGAMSAYGGTDVAYVTDPEARIVQKLFGHSASNLQAAVEAQMDAAR